MFEIGNGLRTGEEGAFINRTNRSVPVFNLSVCFIVVGISLPGHWTPMPRQRNGNEVTVHPVRLAPHSSEFQSVARKFQKTAGSVAIKSVERIQNPLLYQAYQLRKQKMDKDNRGNNERQLFHGTASGNVKKINSQGFNRNFSGLAHGKSRMKNEIDFYSCLYL